MPSLFIITGSNGAGKSTVGHTYLPPEIQKIYSVFDGDKLALQKKQELYPKIIKAYKEARNAADEWLQSHFHDLVTLAIKTMIILYMKVILEKITAGLFPGNLRKMDII